jgi:hypothetical protein
MTEKKAKTAKDPLNSDISETEVLHRVYAVRPEHLIQAYHACDPLCEVHWSSGVSLRCCNSYCIIEPL